MPTPRPQTVTLSAILVTLLTLIALSRLSSSGPESQLRAIQTGLPYLSYGDFFYHREPRDYSRDGQVSKAWQQLTGLHSPDLTVAALIELTHHDDPHIRTLALLGLLAKETREVIPAAIRLLPDRGETFPDQEEPGGRTFDDRKIYTWPRKVGGVARQILDFFEAPYETDKLDAWWKVRQDNPDWLGWYQFLYKRAYRGTSARSTEADEDLRRLRQKVDSLPPVMRSWTMSYLAGGSGLGGLEAFATEPELIASIKTLGPDALLEFLRSGQRLGLQDPALDKGQQGQGFILTHAASFFAPEHASALMEMKHFVAAADTNPKILHQPIEAAMIEHAGEFGQWDRAKAMATLASLGDTADQEQAVKWFYSEPNTDGGSSPQSVFYLEIERRKPARWRNLVRLIVAHPGFEDLRPWDVAYLGFLIPKLGGEKIIPDPAYETDKKADMIRGQLRGFFALKSDPVKTLATPPTLITQPDWKVAWPSPADNLSLSLDGRWLAVGTNQGALVLLTQNGSRLHTFLKPERDTATATFIANGRHLIYAPSYGEVTMIDLTRKEPVETPLPLPGRLSLFPAQSGETAAALDDGHLVWVTLPGLKRLWRQEKRFVRPGSPVVSPDGASVACWDELDKTISLFATADGTVRHRLLGHATPSRGVSFSADSQLLITHGDDKRILIWSVTDGRLLSRFQGSGPAVFTPDASGFFASPSEGVLGLYDRATGEPRGGFKFVPDRPQHKPSEVKDSKTGLISQVYENLAPSEFVQIRDIVLAPGATHAYLLLRIFTPVPGQLGLSKHSSRIERWSLP